MSVSEIRGTHVESSSYGNNRTPGSTAEPVLRIHYRCCRWLFALVGSFALSYQYLRPAYNVKGKRENVGIMFLCEAALGKEATITVDDSRLTKPPEVGGSFGRWGSSSFLLGLLVEGLE